MKNKLRKLILEKRKYIEKETKDNLILNNLFSLPEYKISKNILSYYPLEKEISTIKCFEDTSKTWFLPRTFGENLEICPYNKNELKKGKYNISEPSGEKIQSLEIIDAVITPALAADRSGYRLGYGKGYYDRFFADLTSQNINPIKITLIYSDFLLDTIFPDEYDKKINIIVTDKEILRI